MGFRSFLEYVVPVWAAVVSFLLKSGYDVTLIFFMRGDRFRLK